MSGSWTQRDGIALAEGLSDFGGGGIISAEGFHDWGMRAVPLFSYTLAFALQLRNSTENLSQAAFDGLKLA
jgi:hypothetical protein